MKGLRRRSTRRRVVGRCCAAVGLLVILAAVPAGAQQAGDAPATTALTESDLQEIIVTARKREELVAEVPASVTAFSREFLRDFDIRSFDDYGTKTADLAFAYGNGANAISSARTIAIRGISGAGTTGFYIDDMPVPASLDPRILDIGDIESSKDRKGRCSARVRLAAMCDSSPRSPTSPGRRSACWSNRA